MSSQSQAPGSWGDDIMTRLFPGGRVRLTLVCRVRLNLDPMLPIPNLSASRDIVLNSALVPLANTGCHKEIRWNMTTSKDIQAFMWENPRTLPAEAQNMQRTSATDV